MHGRRLPDDNWVGVTSNRVDGVYPMLYRYGASILVARSILWDGDNEVRLMSGKRHAVMWPEMRGVYTAPLIVRGITSRVDIKTGLISGTHAMHMWPDIPGVYRAPMCVRPCKGWNVQVQDFSGPEVYYDWAGHPATAHTVTMARHISNRPTLPKNKRVGMVDIHRRNKGWDWPEDDLISHRTWVARQIKQYNPRTVFCIDKGVGKPITTWRALWDGGFPVRQIHHFRRQHVAPMAGMASLYWGWFTYTEAAKTGSGPWPIRLCGHNAHPHRGRGYST